MSAHRRPEPLLTRAKATATISGLVSLLVTVGIIPATLGDQVSKTAQAVIAAAALVLSTVPVVLHAWQARKTVTPTSDPRDDAGARLVPVGSAPAVIDAAVALSRAQAIHPAGDAGFVTLAVPLAVLVLLGGMAAGLLVGALIVTIVAVLVSAIGALVTRATARPAPSPLRNMPAGTIGVARTRGFFMSIIRIVTRGPVNHAFVALGIGDVIVEAEPDGAKLGHAREYRDIWWLTNLSAGLTDTERVVIVAWAQNHLGTPYSFLDGACIGLVELFGWAPRFMRRRLSSTKTLMCSQLCDAAYRAAGVDLFTDGRPSGAVSPNDLYRLNYGEPIKTRTAVRMFGVTHPADGTWSPVVSAT